MSAPRVGLYDTLRRLFDTALEMAQVRLALLVNDLELEKQRLLGVAVRALLGLMLLALGLLLAAGTVLLLLWDSHRLAALIGLAVACLTGGAWLLYAARQQLRSDAPLLSATTGELERDRAALQRRDA